MTLFSQKKEYYYDYDWNQITEQVYNNRSLYRAHRIKIEKDSVIINKLEHGKEYGTLSLDSLTKLRAYLKKISGKTLKENNIIVINYYPGKDPCNSSGTRTKGEYKFHYKRYLKKLKKKGKIDQFFIYKSRDNLDKYESKYAIWHKDSRKKIEETFFRFHYNCGSFVVINSNGQYFIRKSEHALGEIYLAIDNFRN